MHLNREEFDSARLTALVSLFKLVGDGLAEVGQLNMTQYRVLLKAHEMRAARIGEIARSLGLKSNVVSQATDSLERQRAVERSRHLGDGRATVVAVTAIGEKTIRDVDLVLERRLVSVWAAIPEDGALVRRLLDSIGLAIERPQGRSGTTSVTSAYLTTVAESYRGVDEVLRNGGRIPLTDWRMLQKARELRGRVRVVELATMLMLPSNTVTGAADRLEARGWLRRTSDAENLQAIYLELTTDGELACDRTQEALTAFARSRLWSHLTDDEVVRTREESLLLIASLAGA